MAYEIDPDFQACASKTLQDVKIAPNRPRPRHLRGDIASRRHGITFITEKILALDDGVTDVTKTEYKASASDGHEIPIFAYRKRLDKTSGSSLQPAILYFHGGGFILGTAELYENSLKIDVEATEVAQFSVEYRLAPEFPHPTPVEDCYSALLWLHSNAEYLGIDKSRIAVVGLSAGGGLAAAVALMGRDRGLSPPLAKQILLCPMLDDRSNVPDEKLAPFAAWTWDDNWTAWNALLGGEPGTGPVSPYAAPARAEDLKGLPPTYIDVGTLDIFAKEDEEYALRLQAAGTSVEWHLYKGVPHGFEFRGRGSKVLQRALEHRHAAMRSL